MAGADRLPKPVWPDHLGFAPREGAGEVQSPVLGEGAGQLRPGDRVWLRHTKSGEIMEHANEVVAVVFGSDGTDVAVALDPLPTYRGEGHAFI